MLIRLHHDVVTHGKSSLFGAAYGILKQESLNASQILSWQIVLVYEKKNPTNNTWYDIYSLIIYIYWLAVLL